MKQLFFKIYLSISLVLVAAALVLSLVSAKGFREVGERRARFAMAPLIEGLREKYNRAETAAERDEVLAHAHRTLPFSLTLLRPEALRLRSDDSARLKHGHLLHSRRGGHRMVYAMVDGGSVMAFGPMPGPPKNANGNIFLWLMAVLVLIGFAVYLLLRPLQQRVDALAHAAQRFGEGSFHTRVALSKGDALARLGADFNHMADRIERLVQSREELLRAVSHEMRTPLSRLFFLIDDGRHAKSADEKDRYLDRIEGTLGEMNELVGELLTFVRLEKEREMPAREAVDTSILAETAKNLADQLGPGLSLEITDLPKTVYASPKLLKRAFQNLVVNAAKHANARIGISGEITQGQAVLRVFDDGPGIPPELEEKIFEPFFRLEGSRPGSPEGSGLGLAIVKRVMERHGGSVTVGDSEWGGALFTLSFPNREDTAASGI